MPPFSGQTPVRSLAAQLLSSRPGGVQNAINPIIGALLQRRADEQQKQQQAEAGPILQQAIQQGLFGTPAVPGTPGSPEVPGIDPGSQFPIEAVQAPAQASVPATPGIPAQQADPSALAALLGSNNPTVAGAAPGLLAAALQGQRAEQAFSRQAALQDDRQAFRLEQSQRSQEAAAQARQGQREFSRSERLERQAFDQAQNTAKIEATLTAAGAKSERAQAKEAFDQTKKLRDEFTKASGDFIKVRDSFGRIVKSAENPDAAGDLALIFNFMKVLDPGSTVREGEFATAQNAAGVPDRVRNIFNRVFDGERLAPEQRRDFVNRAQLLFQQQQRFQEATTGRLTALAESFGLDPTQIVGDLSEGTPALSPQAVATPGAPTAGAQAATAQSIAKMNQQQITTVDPTKLDAAGLDALARRLDELAGQ